MSQEPNLREVDNGFAVRVQLENCVLAGVLAWAGQRPYLAADVLAVAPVSCWAGLDTRAVADAMQRCLRAGVAADLPSVGLELNRMHGEKTGTTRAALEPLLRGRLVEIATVNPYMSEAELMRDAKRIADEARKDAATTPLAGAIRMLQTPGMPSCDVAAHLRGVAEELEHGSSDELCAWESAVDALGADLADGRVCRPLPTPWRNLNRVLRGGIAPGELVIVAARPSVGKTALAVNWAYSVARSGRVAVVASLEMAARQLVERATAAVAHVPFSRFREGFLGTERDKVTNAMREVRSAPVRLVDAVKTTPAEVRRIARAASRGGSLGVVVVDYLQLMTPDHRSASREREVAEMSRAMKTMALELGVPVILLSQLSRKIEDGAKREPQLSDLRESGAIEQDADIVIFLHPSNENPDGTQTVKALVRKGRSSGTGNAWLIFDKTHQRIVDDENEHVWRDMERKPERQSSPGL